MICWVKSNVEKPLVKCLYLVTLPFTGFSTIRVTFIPKLVLSLLGWKVRAQAFAFADEGPVNNMTFYNYVLINQGSQILENTYFGQWLDVDLGNSNDDFVGCDVKRGLGYAYNGDNDDDVSGGPAPRIWFYASCFGCRFLSRPIPR